MEDKQELLRFSYQQQWRAWLEVNHATQKEAWLIIFKKGAAQKGLTLPEAVEEALCYGWIDSLMRPVDTETYQLRFSPRQPGSIWAVANLRRVEQLTRQGRMTPAGMAAVEAAKVNGEWEAASRREDISRVPPGLEQALQADVAALVAYQKMAPSLIKQYHHWIKSAKRPETRQKRIQELVEKLSTESLK